MMQMDTSSTEQPQPVKAITFMDRDLFKAAEDGDMELFNKYQDGDFRCLVDGRQNTALHIYSRTGGSLVQKTDISFLCFPKRRFEREFSSNFVEHLVDKCPTLLLQPNDNGEIPLHIAARHGHDEIVKFLIERAKVMPVPHEDLEKGTSSEETCSWLRRMLRSRDREGNTAFHEAVGSGKVEVVRPLMKELDPDFSISANKRSETPVYIAAKRRQNHRVVEEILDHFKSVDYGGPDGATALHAAVMESDNRRTIGILLKAKEQLTKKTDDKGRTPLHYAAHLSKRLATKLLLKKDASVAYIIDKERAMTALHMAAWVGRFEIMRDIIYYCPGCCEIVDKRGWNFLHFAVSVSKPKELERLLYGNDKSIKIKDSPIGNLLFEKDVNGNTPVEILHMFSKGLRYYSVHSFLRRQGFHISIKEAQANYEEKKIREIMKEICDNAEVAGIRPYKFLLKNKDDEKNLTSFKEIMDDLRETHLLVAVLIATVTFAAAITTPGGYRTEGTATLSHNSAFKAFVITDAIAFVSSLLAIFLHFLCVFVDLKLAQSIVVKWVLLADGLTVFAMAAMVVSFSAGTYAVLESSMGTAIATCSIGLTSFPFLSLYLFLPTKFRNK